MDCFCALHKERRIGLRLLLRHHHRRMDYSWLQMYVLVFLQVTAYPPLLYASWPPHCACSLLMDIFSLKEYPVEYGHTFLVPTSVNEVSCYWDKRMFGLATKIASEVSNAAFRVFFDGGTSVMSDRMFFQVIFAYSQCLWPPPYFIYMLTYHMSNYINSYRCAVCQYKYAVCTTMSRYSTPQYLCLPFVVSKCYILILACVKIHKVDWHRFKQWL